MLSACNLLLIPLLLSLPLSETPSPVKAELKQLAWMTGSYTGPALGGYCEEHWSEPRGESMMAMFRLINGKGKTSVYEMLLIEQHEQHLRLTFRHYGFGNKAWEPNDKPLTFDAIEISENRIVFHNLGDQTNPRRMTYRRQGDTLDVHIQNETEGKLEEGFHVKLKAAKK